MRELSIQSVKLILSVEAEYAADLTRSCLMNVSSSTLEGESPMTTYSTNWLIFGIHFSSRSYEAAMCTLSA